MYSAGCPVELLQEVQGRNVVVATACVGDVDDDGDASGFVHVTKFAVVAGQVQGCNTRQEVLMLPYKYANLKSGGRQGDLGLKHLGLLNNNDCYLWKKDLVVSRASSNKQSVLPLAVSRKNASNDREKIQPQLRSIGEGGRPVEDPPALGGDPVAGNSEEFTGSDEEFELDRCIDPRTGAKEDLVRHLGSDCTLHGERLKKGAASGQRRGKGVAESFGPSERVLSPFRMRDHVTVKLLAKIEQLTEPDLKLREPDKKHELALRHSFGEKGGFQMTHGTILVCPVPPDWRSSDSPPSSSPSLLLDVSPGSNNDDHRGGAGDAAPDHHVGAADTDSGLPPHLTRCVQYISEEIEESEVALVPGGEDGDAIRLCRRRRLKPQILALIVDGLHRKGALCFWRFKVDASMRPVWVNHYIVVHVVMRRDGKIMLPMHRLKLNARQNRSNESKAVSSFLDYVNLINSYRLAYRRETGERLQISSFEVVYNDVVRSSYLSPLNDRSVKSYVRLMILMDQSPSLVFVLFSYIVGHLPRASGSDRSAAHLTLAYMDIPLLLREVDDNRLIGVAFRIVVEGIWRQPKGWLCRMKIRDVIGRMYKDSIIMVQEVMCYISDSMPVTRQKRRALAQLKTTFSNDFDVPSGCRRGDEELILDDDDDDDDDDDSGNVGAGAGANKDVPLQGAAVIGRNTKGDGNAGYDSCDAQAIVDAMGITPVEIRDSLETYMCLDSFKFEAGTLESTSFLGEMISAMGSWSFDVFFW